MIEPHTHAEFGEIRKENSEVRRELQQTITELGKKIDDQLDRWMNWSDTQGEKQEVFRTEVVGLVNKVKGAVDQKEALDSTLLATVQRIEKDFDQISSCRERDLKEIYTMAGKQAENDRDIKAAHDKYRDLNKKVDTLIQDLPQIVQDAVKSALVAAEARNMKKIFIWIGGIVAVIIAEFIVFKLTMGK